MKWLLGWLDDAPRAAGAVGVVAIAAACGGGDSPARAGLEGAPGCVAFTETATVISGDGQSAAPGSVLPERVTAKFSCESFTSRGTVVPMTGSVSWNANPGLVDGALWITKPLGADGLTSVTWTMPNSWDGPQQVSVSLLANGARSIDARFTATLIGTTTTALTCDDPGGTDHGPQTVITTDTAWPAAGSPHRGGTVRVESGARLSIEAGSVICVSAFEPAANASQGGFLTARGTAQAPIRFFGTALRLADRLSHVRGENLPAVGRFERPIEDLADSIFRWTASRDPSACVQVFAAVGSEMRRTVISGYGSPQCAALRLVWHPGWDYGWGYNPRIEVRVLDSIGDGISLSGGVAFDLCEVSASGRHAIVVLNEPFSEAISAAACNFFGNGGSAIVNQGTTSIVARGNWWGDPAGPSGPNGDGIAGPVDAGDPRAAPAVLGY